MLEQASRSTKLTCTSCSISGVAIIAGTCEGPSCVCTHGIRMTRRLVTFIDICRNRSASQDCLFERRRNKRNMLEQASRSTKLTCTSCSISGVAIIAGTCEGPSCVCTHGIRMTRRLVTFIDICRNRSASRYCLFERRRNKRNMLEQASRSTKLTCTSCSISSVAIIAGTCEGPSCVCTHGIRMTRRLVTFIDICRNRSASRYCLFERRRNKRNMLEQASRSTKLTCTSCSISGVAIIAGTCEGPSCVCTHGIRMTRRLVTFIDICRNRSASRYCLFERRRNKRNMLEQASRSTKLTCTSCSISGVAIIAGTCEGPSCVCTHGIRMTRRLVTFIDICRNRSASQDCLFERRRNKRNMLEQASRSTKLTCASCSISGVAIVAGTCEGPRCVCTHGIRMTRRLVTFINICRNRSASQDCLFEGNAISATC